jgi:N-acetyl-gamma-glutamyl-phosphate reductase
VHPTLAGKKGPEVEPIEVDRVVALRPDAVFLATPNELSASLARPLVDAGIAVVDLSGAFRLKDRDAYPRWYGFHHPHPELLRKAVYGLTEWCPKLRDAGLVANPGCYPTSVLLALRPLERRLLAGAPVICDSKSGVSGAGKRSDLAFSFCELAGNFKAYGVGVHRHEPEMRAELGFPADAPFVFVPHLLPVVRGILSTIHVTFTRPLEAPELLELYETAYGGSPFVHVLPPPELPDLASVVGTPRAEIGFALLQGGRQGVIVSAIDNLLKGAASQAIQNFNRVFGLEETEGLEWN